jgi:hypothetical protein
MQLETITGSDRPRRTLPYSREEARQILELSINEGLREVLGKSGVEMISSLGSTDVFSADPRKLHTLLVSVFADQGALIIERAIMGMLMNKLDDAGLPSVGSGPRPLSNSGRAPASLKRDVDSEHKAKAFRLFAEIADLPGDHSKHHHEPLRVAMSSKRARDSMESTAAVFVDAFVKGM